MRLRHIEADVIELPEILSFESSFLMECRVAYAFETYCILSISTPIQFALKLEFWPACPKFKTNDEEDMLRCSVETF